MFSASLKGQTYNYLSLDEFEINNPSYIGMKESSHVSISSKQSFDLQSKTFNNSSLYGSFFFDDLNFFIGYELSSFNFSEFGLSQYNASLSYTYKLNLNNESLVMEIAANDGYLLKNFVNKGIPNFGVEPTESTANYAMKQGICIDQEFFGHNYANKLASSEAPISETYKRKRNSLCDLIIGNNVYAHVPDINDFTHGLKIALSKSGTINLEFPHLLNLIQLSQFDTVYHEHFSYLSLYTVVTIFEKYGLKIYKVEKIVTHGGSLRIYGCHDDDPRPIEKSVDDLLLDETNAGLRRLSTFEDFQSKAELIKDDLLTFLLTAKRSNKKVAAYGAAAKGNTLLNFSGVKPDLISSVFDAAHAKQDKFLPGSHIPILKPSIIREIKPDFLLILPWNLQSEVISSCSYISEWGGKFVVAVPELKIL